VAQAFDVQERNVDASTRQSNAMKHCLKGQKCETTDGGSDTAAKISTMMRLAMIPMFQYNGSRQKSKH
jgi:hypothetical protein